MYIIRKTTEDIKELFKELTEEIENDLGDCQSLPETDEDVRLKEKIINDIND